MPAPPSVDAEAEAASIFSEGEKKKDEGPTSIKFKCEYCDQDLDLPMDQADKRIPCPNPECRRIIKVPNPLAKVEKKDWLKSAPADRTLRRRAPGTGGKTAEVSEEALEEAGVIEAEPRTLKEKILRGLVAVAVLSLVGWGGWSIWSWWGGRKEKAAIEVAVIYGNDPKNEKSEGKSPQRSHGGAACRDRRLLPPHPGSGKAEVRQRKTDSEGTRALSTGPEEGQRGR